MTDKLKAISKETAIPVTIGFMIALLTGVWFLAIAVQRWEARLSAIESKIGSGWTFFMAREAWREFERLNSDVVIPDVNRIKSVYSVTH